MAVQPNLTESSCLTLIDNVSDLLMEESTESAVAAIVEQMREVFGVSCVNIREIIARPYSLRYTYESINTTGRPRRINETCSFTETVWKGALKRFSQGSYQYRAGTGQSVPQLLESAPEIPQCLLQVPMFCGSHFLGILELLDFEGVREWSECELSALNVCANLICQYLYRVNSTFMQLHSQNDIDPLTGMLNFHAFTELLDKKLPEMLRLQVPIAVVYTDIHHFKYINETYGYKKGDELLKLAAQAMTEGAEELGVLRCRAHADHFITAAPLEERLAPIFDSFIHQQNEIISELLQKHCPDVRIRVVTGICYVQDSSMTAATAIANANLARKVAKSENSHRPLVFSDDMMEEIKYQEYLNNELPKAIENRSLKVYYQPKINCSDDSLYGAEALVRWQKPDGTFIYPDQFIPFFEKNGNITDIDFYVYREVFRYIRERLDAGLPVFPISMNVSRVHFRSDRIMPYLEELLDEYRIPPELLEFELTENMYMKNFSKADRFIKDCRDRGIQVSMDDFGSGYSSLNVISSLNIDTLKIDRVFLKNEDLNANDKTVLESMIAMAKRLGMKVICEGVETRSQTMFLKGANCDQIQGYYYGKPMDETAFNEYAAKLLEQN